MSAAKKALIVSFAAAAVALLIAGPIPQPAAYHDFADTRSLGPLPNWQNVLSNLVFLAAGALGLLWCARQRSVEFSASWCVVFVGAIAIFFGSAWYHLRPDNATLLWDRIPIGITFMAYLVALLNEYVDERVNAAWLVVLVPASSMAVVYWYVTGDLRAWILVQGFPILATPLVLWLAPRRRGTERYLWIACACYVVAKAAELADHAVYEYSAQLISGHVIKHLLAGAGVFCFWRMLAARSYRAAPDLRMAPSR